MAAGPDGAPPKPSAKPVCASPCSMAWRIPVVPHPRPPPVANHSRPAPGASGGITPTSTPSPVSWAFATCSRRSQPAPSGHPRAWRPRPRCLARAFSCPVLWGRRLPRSRISSACQLSIASASPDFFWPCSISTAVRPPTCATTPSML